MANVVVVGAQWGDEGKGKIVDWLSEQADVVVRFQGGHNAGHTLVIGDKVYKLSLLPSGVVRPNKLSVIGNGVVLDPHALAAEVERLKEQGVAISRENLRVAENATLILSIHRELDALRLAYATSIHKSQGSEYPAVVIPLSTSHFPMLSRNLLYTAVTRAKRLCVLVADQRALRVALDEQRRERRSTGLTERLRRAAEAAGAGLAE